MAVVLGKAPFRSGNPPLLACFELVLSRSGINVEIGNCENDQVVNSPAGMETNVVGLLGEKFK